MDAHQISLSRSQFGVTVHNESLNEHPTEELLSQMDSEDQKSELSSSCMSESECEGSDEFYTLSSSDESTDGCSDECDSHSNIDSESEKGCDQTDNKETNLNLKPRSRERIQLIKT